MLPIKYAIKRCFNMPPQITYASALPGKMGKHENHTFSLKCYISRERCSSWAVLYAQCTSALSSERKIVVRDVFDSVCSSVLIKPCSFVEIVRYSINTVQ